MSLEDENVNGVVVQDQSDNMIFKAQVTDGRFYQGRLSQEFENEDEAFFILDQKTAILQVFDSLCQINPTDYYIVSGSIVVIDLEQDAAGHNVMEGNTVDHAYFVLKPPNNRKNKKHTSAVPLKIYLPEFVPQEYL